MKHVPVTLHHPACFWDCYLLLSQDALVETVVNMLSDCVYHWQGFVEPIWSFAVRCELVDECQQLLKGGRLGHQNIPQFFFWERC